MMMNQCGVSSIRPLASDFLSFFHKTVGQYNYDYEGCVFDAIVHRNKQRGVRGLWI